MQHDRRPPAIVIPRTRRRVGRAERVSVAASRIATRARLTFQRTRSWGHKTRHPADSCQTLFVNAFQCLLGTVPAAIVSIRFGGRRVA
jgi:hypothetical protein